MAGRQDTPAHGDDAARIFDGAFRLVVVLAAVLIVLVVIRSLDQVTSTDRGPASGSAGAAAVGASPSTSAAPAASIDMTTYLRAFSRPAPPLELTGPDGQPVSLAALRGTPVLVFFGYTHCPDVCPVTIGAVGEAIDAYSADAKAIFVSVDPERDTVPWLAEFVKYMPAGFTAVTGTPTEVATAANAWGVRYAKVDTGDPENYSMAHTADVFLIDGNGDLRASFPFGTPATTMTAVLRQVVATTASPAPSAVTTATPSAAPTPAPTLVPPASTAPSATPGPSASTVVDLWPQVVSTSVWAGGSSPVILGLYDESSALVDDPTLKVTAQLVDDRGTPVGPVVPAPAVQPVGVRDVSFVPTVDIPSPGRWRLAVSATAADGSTRHGFADINALDQGGSARLGAPAPTVRTPTAADFGGDLSWVTTDPLPDPRLSATSTADALAAHQPFVLVVDSIRFRVTAVCGRAVVMAKQLVDRWTNVPFIHAEPYRFDVVTTEPVLQGSLTNPVMTDAADAWGVGDPPWGVGSMPWVFVVDGNGIVRAKYQGVMGSADVDVILSLLAAGR
jgi:protein SCO1/2